MDTLPSTDTLVFITPEQREALIEGWPGLSPCNALMIMVYAILRGKDWRKGFTPITGRIKLENGGFHAWAFWAIADQIARLKLASDESSFPSLLKYCQRTESALLEQFQGLVTKEMLRGALACLPNFPDSYKYGAERYTRSSWPFATYAPNTDRRVAIAS